MVTAPAPFAEYKGKPVLLTGHTGFKGAWLALWLQRLGARVTGIALPPENAEQDLYAAAGIGDGMRSILADIRNLDRLRDEVDAARPEIIFHLAAQSLVRRSYARPVETFGTNVMGTAHVLEAVRHQPSVKAVVIVTSDKCYETTGRAGGYSEEDPLGGADPYSASKGAAEILVAGYRRSFFSNPDAALVASARAGNVMGGGDWAEDRLVPDIAKAIQAGKPVVLRNPDSVRPWQHVLEPLRGYLVLGSKLLGGNRNLAGAWNFGPRGADMISVRELAGRVVDAWGAGTIVEQPDDKAPSETAELRLKADKAARRLNVRPLLNVSEAIELTVTWYRGFLDHAGAARTLTEAQIEAYMERCG